MDNGPFIDDFPIKTSIYTGFSMAMLNNQRVYLIGGLEHGFLEYSPATNGTELPKNGILIILLQLYLIGGLEHGSYDFPYIGNDHPI